MTLRSYLKDAAGRTFVIVWLLALVAIAVQRGISGALPPVGIAAGVILFCAFTSWLTRTPNADPAGDVAPDKMSGRAWAQLSIVFVLLVLTVHRGMVFHNQLPDELVTIPVWSAGLDLLSRLSAWLQLPNENFLINPVTYAGIPALWFLLLRIKPRWWGFRMGNGTVVAVLIWCTPIVAWWVYQLVTGQTALAGIGRKVLGNAFQNGFFEEFLFRGALLYGLARLMGLKWALTLSSVMFGLWHLGAVLDHAGGDVIVAIATCIYLQGMMGFGLGFVLCRTRNLAACSVIHVACNSL